MKKIFIYLLIDPRRPEIVRYVGQTATPHSRLIQHCCESGKSAKCQWLEIMARDGVMPSMIIVEETTELYADQQEALWLARFSSANAGKLENKNAVTKEARFKEKVESEVAQPEKRSLAVLSEVEHDIIMEAIRDANGDKTLAAESLNISVATLYRKLGAKSKKHQPNPTK